MVNGLDNIFIDTEIWTYSFKTPSKDNYPDETTFQADLSMHERALLFFKTLAGTVNYYLTTHQVCELYHVLRFRGAKMEPNQAKKIVQSISNSKNATIINVTAEHVTKSIELSVKSNIHVWDYICVVPLIGQIVKMYTTDQHFNHATFQDLGVEIENPLGTWESL
jgi:predicted nucleic acid-binding protein